MMLIPTIAPFLERLSAGRMYRADVYAFGVDENAAKAFTQALSVGLGLDSERVSLHLRANSSQASYVVVVREDEKPLLVYTIPLRGQDAGELGKRVAEETVYLLGYVRPNETLVVIDANVYSYPRSYAEVLVQSILDQLSR